PSLRTALFSTFDRAAVFLKKAGTNILAICIILWWLKTYPHVDPPPAAERLSQQARQIATTDPVRARALDQEAHRLAAPHHGATASAGRLGRPSQPLLAPLGYDRQLTVGILTSFAAREVFVSTMAVVTAGEEDKDKPGVLETVAAAKRDDGSPVFTP